MGLGKWSIDLSNLKKVRPFKETISRASGKRRIPDSVGEQWRFFKAEGSVAVNTLCAAMELSKDKFFSLILVSVILCQIITQTGAEHRKPSDSDEDDFYDDEDYSDSDEEPQNYGESSHSNSVLSWSSSQDLCKDVSCKPNQYCVVKGHGRAICVLKKSKPSSILTKEEEKHNLSEFLSRCKPCPVVKPEFYCGNDNATYSSLCRLKYHNCVHETGIKVVCKGFCPCKQGQSKFSHPMNLVKKQKYVRKENNIKKSSRKYKQLEKYKKTYRGGHGSIKPRFHTKYDHNSVIYEKPRKHSGDQLCSKSELKEMGSRLSSWFSVVLRDQRLLKKQRRQKPISNFKIPDCKTDSSWMFHHLDTNGDLMLSLRELFDLEHDDREKCLKQYLDTCDEDRDLFLNPYEWCTCFDQQSKPCASAAGHSKRGLIGAYVPQCDQEGFYRSRQCHGSSGICWCVDKHGVEFSNTRRRGKPDCKGMLEQALQRNKVSTKQLEIEEDDDDDDDDDSDSDYDSDSGSGDNQFFDVKD